MSRRQRKQVTSEALLERAGSEAVRPTVGEIRDAEREGAWQFNWPGADLPNPEVVPEFDRTWPQGRQAKVTALGFNPNTPQSLADLQVGDAGNAQSVFRRIQVYHLLGEINPGRVGARPYSNAVGLATLSSSNQRPRYYHCSLFATGQPRNTGGTPDTPIPAEFINTFAPGISASIGAVVPAAYIGVPLIPTVKFRVLIQDESGGRYFDVDVMGARSFNVYAFSVTVFVLLKEGGYQVDPTVNNVDQEALGPGVVENAIVGARIIPVFQNQTQNTDLRTCTLAHPGGNVGRNVPIPPGAKRLQVYNMDGGGVPALYTLSFTAGSPFGDADDSNTNMGFIDFIPGIGNRTEIIDIPNSNEIRVRGGPGVPATQFSFVFEVDSG